MTQTLNSILEIVFLLLTFSILIWIYKEIKTAYLNRKLRKLSTSIGLSYAKHKRTSLFKIENGFLVGQKNGRDVEIKRNSFTLQINSFKSLEESLSFMASYTISIKCNHFNTQYEILKLSDLVPPTQKNIMITDDYTFNGFYRIIGQKTPSFNTIFNPAFKTFLISHYHNITGAVLLKDNYLEINEVEKMYNFNKNLIFIVNVALQAAEKIEKSHLAQPVELIDISQKTSKYAQKRNLLLSSISNTSN